MRPALMLLLLLTFALYGTIARTVASPLGMSAADPHVFDGGMFFSEEAVSEADDIIRDMKRAYGRDLVVETYPGIPDPMKEDLARDGKEKFFENWLNRRAKQLGVRGVFVLMTREPGRVQVGVDKTTRQRAFTVADGEALREILVSAFRAKEFDRGLLGGARFVRARMGDNAAAERSPAVPVVTAAAPSKHRFSR